jgi:hypothetical protein
MCISPIHRGQYQSNVRWLIESPSECDVTMTSNSLLRSVGIGVELGMHWLPPKSPMRACPESELHAVLIRRELIDCNMLWRQQNLVRHRPDCCNPFFSFARLSAFRSSTLRISTGCHRAVVANSDALFSSQHFMSVTIDHNGRKIVEICTAQYLTGSLYVELWHEGEPYTALTAPM